MVRVGLLQLEETLYGARKFAHFVRVGGHLLEENKNRYEINVITLQHLVDIKMFEIHL